MTAKDKARELVDAAQTGLWEDRGVEITQEDAAYLVAVVVGEIIEGEIQAQATVGEKPWWWDIGNRAAWWTQVKQELENI